LQDQAQQAMAAIREMGRHGIAMVQVTRDAVGRDLLQPDQAKAIEETLERVARFRGLLDRLQDCTRRSAEKFLAEARSPTITKVVRVIQGAHDNSHSPNRAGWRPERV
jgi:cytosine/adenosine deaminase-related metal-dependent hydrolase